MASGQYQPGQSQSSAGAPSQQQANTQAHNNQYKSNMVILYNILIYQFIRKLI